MLNRILVAVSAIALLLMMEHASAAAETKKITWAGCGISKNAFMTEMAAAYKKKTGIEVELKGGGATKGIRDVASHEVDIGGTCRHVIEDNETLRTVPEERRVQLIPVAWDALVVIVHKDNPVDSVTLDQVRDIYTGKIANWKQLGGKNAPVELYVRKGKISGVGRTLRELVFHNYDQEFVAKHVVEESATLEKDMVTNPNGIGITGVSSARKIKDIAKILKLDGKEPSYENIKSGAYLLYRPLYMVTHLQSVNPEVNKFLKFVLGPDGQEVMRRVGAVPYEDGINLWSKYLDQQNKAIAKQHAQTDLSSPKTKPRSYAKN
jgi:phosphate transport system substrate-binding protein